MARKQSFCINSEGEMLRGDELLSDISYVDGEKTAAQMARLTKKTLTPKEYGLLKQWEKYEPETNFHKYRVWGEILDGKPRVYLSIEFLSTPGNRKFWKAVAQFSKCFGSEVLLLCVADQDGDGVKEKQVDVLTSILDWPLPKVRKLIDDMEEYLESDRLLEHGWVGVC